jgi:regulator of RNase E activity RraA
MQSFINQESSMTSTSLPSLSIQARIEKLDSSELSDALDSLSIEGVLQGIKPLKSQEMLFGQVFTVQYALSTKGISSFQSPLNYIEEVPPNAVILIDNQGRIDCTVWGDLLTAQSLYQNVAGVVVHGAVRDQDQLVLSRLKIFSKDYGIRSGKNRVCKVAHQTPLTIGAVHIHPGDYLFGDANGVLIIPQNQIEEIVSRAENISARESLIRKAIQSGIPLAEARTQYRYDQPWLPLEGSQC